MVFSFPPEHGPSNPQINLDQELIGRVRNSQVIPSPADCILSDQSIALRYRDGWSEEAYIEAWLACNRYGGFELTDAVRPFLAPEENPSRSDLPKAPIQGYRIGEFRLDSGERMARVANVAVSKELAFDLFLELLEPLGKTVDLVLQKFDYEDSHPKEFIRQSVNFSKLESYLTRYQSFLLNDGCTGIAVVNSSKELEVQFDSHKLITLFAGLNNSLAHFLPILEQSKYNIPCNPDMAFISEGLHIHSSYNKGSEIFGSFAQLLDVREYQP